MAEETLTFTKSESISQASHDLQTAGTFISRFSGKEGLTRGVFGSWLFLQDLWDTYQRTKVELDIYKKMYGELGCTTSGQDVKSPSPAPAEKQ